MPVGNVGDAHRRFGLVDVLSARAGRAIGVDAAIALVDLDLDPVVDDRIDPDRGKARVPAGVGIERRDAHQTMDARLGLQPAMRVVALDDDRRRLDAGLVARRLFDQLDLELSPLRPAHVHAQQHARPVAALGAAGPGMHFDIAVVGVGLARKQRFELTPFALGLERFERRRFPRLRPPRRLRPRRVRPRSLASSRSRSIFASEPSRSSSIVRSRITFWAKSGLVQRLGSSDLAFSSARRRVAASTSKMPPQQSHGLLDRFRPTVRLRRA